MRYRKALKQSSSLLILYFSIAGCGDSPLLNHNEKNPSSREASSSEPAVQKRCDLKFEQSQICATLTWLDGPTESATQSGDTLQVDFWSTASQEKFEIPKEQLMIKLWMPSMGHGSRPVKIEKKDESFLVREIFFIMPGKWEVWFTVHLSSGQEEKQKIEIVL